MTLRRRHRFLYDPYLGVMINDTTFKIDITRSFKKVKLKKAIKHIIACLIAYVCFGNYVVDITQTRHQLHFCGQYFIRNLGKLFLQLNGNCKINIGLKNENILKLVSGVLTFISAQNSFSSKKCNF